MKFIIFSSVLSLALPLTSAQPFNNGSVAFCHRRSAGLYCNAADALHIVECPGGDRVACPANTFCASVGRVPDCYQCEAGFNEIKFCDIRGPGTYCAPAWTGSKGVWSCPDGREHPCPYGSECKKLSRHAAICAPCHVEKMEKAVQRCGRHTYTSHTICDCTEVTTTPTSTVSFYDLTLSSVTSSFSVCAGRSTVTLSTTQVTPVTTYTLVLDFTETFTESYTSNIQSIITTFSTDTSTSFSTIGQTPAFVCLEAQSFTNTSSSPSVQYICLTGTIDVDCAVTTTNNIGESFCESFVLPQV